MTGAQTRLSSSLNDVVVPSSSNPPNKPEEHKYYPLGWICPKCGSVYGPHVSECWRCSSRTITCTYIS